MSPFSRFTRYFIEVARQGSIRKASEVLHVSASAIDRQILRAEEALGAPLFERLPGRLRLTAAGELLLMDVRQWEKAFARTLARFDELKGLRRGHVEIALIDALSEGPVIQALARLLRLHSGLSLGLATVGNREVGRRIAAAEVDFGLMLDPVAGPALEVRAFARVPLGIAMPPEHELARRGELQLAEVLDYGLLLPDAPLTVSEHARLIYQRQHIDTQRLTRCDNVRTLRALIRAGAGVGLLSWLDAAPDVVDGRLAFVPLRADLAPPLTVALCVSPQRQLSAAAQRAIQLLGPLVESGLGWEACGA